MGLYAAPLASDPQVVIYSPKHCGAKLVLVSHYHHWKISLSLNSCRTEYLSPSEKNGYHPAARLLQCHWGHGGWRLRAVARGAAVRAQDFCTACVSSAPRSLLLLSAPWHIPVCCTSLPRIEWEAHFPVPGSCPDYGQYNCF